MDLLHTRKQCDKAKAENHPEGSMLEKASGGHFQGRAPGRPRQLTNLCWKWPPEAISKEVPQGSPANVQTYADTCACKRIQAQTNVYEAGGLDAHGGPYCLGRWGPGRRDYYANSA